MQRPSSLFLGALSLLPVACKDGSPQEAQLAAPGAGGAPADPIAASVAGDGGCNGADQTFAGCEEILLTTVLAAVNVASLTRITGASSAADLLYATAVNSSNGDSTAVAIDLTDALNPVVTNLLPAGALNALVTSIVGAPAQGVLGELCVLDASHLVAVELTSNTLVAIGRTAPGSLQRFAGGAGGGFFDGSAATALFAFDPASQVCATGDGRLFVADTGNDALRVILGNPLFEPTSFVATLVGGLGAGFADGPLAAAMLDAPTGVVATCDDRLLVTERGDGGAGQRVRRVTLFGFDPVLGAITGDVSTAAGDGTAASTAGVGAQARVAGPMAPRTSSGGEAYWIDATTGTLRRKAGASDAVDCALAACGTPSMACSAGGPDFTPGASFSTAISGAGDLVVLRSGTTLLRRF